MFPSANLVMYVDFLFLVPGENAVRLHNQTTDYTFYFWYQVRIHHYSEVTQPDPGLYFLFLVPGENAVRLHNQTQDYTFYFWYQVRMHHYSEVTQPDPGLYFLFLVPGENASLQ